MKLNKVNKKKNTRVVVENWSNTVKVFDLNTNEKLGEQSFKDHIVAVYLAKKL